MVLRQFLPSLSTRRVVECLVERNERKKSKGKKKRRIVWIKKGGMKHGESKH